MLAPLVVSLAVAYAHLYRDGFPATHSTHLARAIGGFIVFWGYGTQGEDKLLAAAIVGGAFWIGFYVDQKHGEAQADAGWLDWKGWLLRLYSGTTSVALPILALGGLHAFELASLLTAAALFGAGVAKTIIWPGWWSIRPDRLWAWLEPCRVSALTFGALVGLALWVH